MAYSLHISIQAQADIVDAIDHYDRIGKDLGNRFLEELIGAYQKIKAAPETYSFISADQSDKFRDLKLPSFPHVIIYEISGSSIFVAAVMNTYRKPFL